MLNHRVIVLNTLILDHRKLYRTAAFIQGVQVVN